MPKRVPTFRPPWLTRKRESRPNAHGRGYGSAAWQRVRLAVIARDKGVCQLCGIMPHGPGECHIDHIQAKPVDEAAEATPLEGLRLLCRGCHSRVTNGAVS